MLLRDLKDSPKWINASSVARDVFVTLMLNACWKPTEWNEYGEIITLNPGQLITSIKGISEVCARGTSERQVRVALEYLKKVGMVSTSRARKKTLITLLLWDKSDFQNLEVSQSASQCCNDDVTKNVTSTDGERSVGVELINKELTSNKYINIYRGENEKPKRQVKRFVKPDVEEVKAFFDENGFTFDTAVQAEKFFDYYEANGWTQGKSCKPLKNWKAAARNWARNAKEWSANGELKPGNHGRNKKADAANAGTTEGWGEITGL